ncbi:hypothetical protein LSM04_002659 [Trypanosoma melophagium]|uniref:uncharacterized protein n=1 Tax=Trypanosoma melophagium TaxID=715481 RepID=UPI003519E345|nr:hypothetical protein LSM04_002659 [Trypanosoma melophagium]
MEGDDIVAGFYDLLCKRNPKTMKPCRNVFVPDTVVYEHNFPRGWYTTDVKAREVMRRQGRDLDAATIEESFKRNVCDGCPIVATYLSTLEEDVGDGVTEVTTQVEVLNKESVSAFIARKKKREGILQRFVFPKGYHNSVIRVVWSPRVAMIQRRTNKFPIMDRKRAENDPYAITVTYEGPEYLSEEGTVSAHVAFEVKNICSDIVTHFFYTEHKYITRMVLYFKSDARDRLWFLWCGSLRVADRNTPSEMPVSLACKFGEPAQEGDLDEDEVLRTTDKAYFLVTHDEFFYETYVRGREGNASHGVRAQESRPAATDPTTAQRSAAAVEGDVSGRADVEGADKFPPEVAAALERVRAQEEEVLGAFADIFYRAYSHFLVNVDAPFALRVPPHVVQILTESSVVDLMRVLKLQPKPCGGTKESDDGDAAMVYVIPPKFRSPLTQTSDTAESWIRELFASRREALKRSYLAGEMPSCAPPSGTTCNSSEGLACAGEGGLDTLRQLPADGTNTDRNSACGGVFDPEL